MGSLHFPLFGHLPACYRIFATIPPPYNGTALIALAVLDIATAHIMTFVQYVVVMQQNKQWMDHLADRLFVKMATDHIRNGTANKIDVDDMYNQATKAAVADINLAVADENIFGPSWPRLARAGAVAGRIVFGLFSYIVFYGTAAMLGSALK